MTNLLYVWQNFDSIMKLGRIENVIDYALSLSSSEEPSSL